MRKRVLELKVDFLYRKLMQAELKIADLEKARDDTFTPGWYVLYNDMPSGKNKQMFTVGYFNTAREYADIRARWACSKRLDDADIVRQLFANESLS